MVTATENPDNGEKQLNAMEASSISEIQQYFSGINVFVTGATGFIGKLLVEKLLRTCLDLKTMYILIRTKKGKSIEERYQELLGTVIFDGLKKENPRFTEKIILMAGDCTLPDLGLSDKDKQILIAEVSCVFHCAATVRFDEKIWTAAYSNVRATRDILAISRKMKNLTSFIYVSTAYSHCVRPDIGENIYDPTITGDNLLKLVDTLDQDMLDKITPILIEKWPNTYTFTKAIAEEVIRSEAKGLPVAIVRPSIVIGTVKEPIAGWIDNVYGATGVFVGVGMGLIHTVHCDPELCAEMVPADFVINCTIAAAWNTSLNKPQKTQGTFDTDIPVYNYVSTTQKPIKWKEVLVSLQHQHFESPSTRTIWYPFVSPTASYLVYTMMAFLTHIVPAYILDSIARCLGKKPILVKSYKKIHKLLDVLSYFVSKEWQFQNKNTQSLWKKLNREDQKLFDFNLDTFDWDSYFYTYSRGGRMFLLKDPLDTIPQGKIRHFKLKIAHYVLVGVLLLILLKLSMVLLNVMF